MAQTLYEASLGTYTFPFDPVVNTPRKLKSSSSQETWASSQFMNDGFYTQESGLIGNELKLTWEIMAGAFFEMLNLYYEAQGPITWDAKERARVSGEKYEMYISELDFNEEHRTSDYLLDVSMTVNIRKII